MLYYVFALMFYAFFPFLPVLPPYRKYSNRMIGPRNGGTSLAASLWGTLQEGWRGGGGG